MRHHPFLFVLFSLLLIPNVLFGQQDSAKKPRARDLGVPFDGTPGPLNAITDVSGVLVGHTTLISGEGKLVVGKGPVRTGVTAVLPRGIGNAGEEYHPRADSVLGRECVVRIPSCPLRTTAED